jgi:hypothetical protein
MILHDTAAETSFLASFDADFPYDDEARASALIRQGWELSLNAACCILSELCRPPHAVGVSRDRQLQLLATWSDGFEHPLKEPLLLCARTLIDHESLPWPDAVTLMERIGVFGAQRAALSIAYFAGDCDTEEGDTALEAAYRRIEGAWSEKGI